MSAAEIRRVKWNLILLGSLSVPLLAQWRIATPGVPRDPAGKPALTAAVPVRGGKPDLSGIWLADEPKGLDLTAGLEPGELVMTPWAQALFDQRQRGEHDADNPEVNCLPQGVPKIDSMPPPFKIIQARDVIVFLYEMFSQFRQVFLDGRPLPRDPNPQWNGYSTAHWDGETLVVESTGFNGKAWLDYAGHPTTESLHVIERFHRRDFGHMDVTATITDSGAYAKPWSYTQPLKLVVDDELMEGFCENEKDAEHVRARKQSVGVR